MYTYHGTFDAYTPDELPEGMPADIATRILWLRNEFGEDLYALRPQLPADRTFVVVNPDHSIRIVLTDRDALFPSAGGKLYSTTDEVVADPLALLSKRFNPSTLVIEDKPPSVPRRVSKAQGMMALYNAGLLGQLESIIANHPYPPVRVWFANANHWERDSPYIQSLGPELGLTEEDIDGLFVAAALLAS